MIPGHALRNAVDMVEMPVCQQYALGGKIAGTYFTEQASRLVLIVESGIDDCRPAGPVPQQDSTFLERVELKINSLHFVSIYG